MMNQLKREFTSRSELVEHVASLADWLEPCAPSEFFGGQTPGQERLGQIDPQGYCRSRNFLDGKVTRLSPYIRHGILTLNQVRNAALALVSTPAQIEKFIQELAWRDYWQRVYYRHPDYIWQDIEHYKTGLTAADYADQLPEDVACGRTGVGCIDQFIGELLQTGYLHNHARMYLAAYVVHWRRVKWQAGAKWFLHHLLDGDPASNNLSWQWVASTFSNKPYIFNLDNVRKYAHPGINTSQAANIVLDASYDELAERLFAPKRGLV